MRKALRKLIALMALTAVLAGQAMPARAGTGFEIPGACTVRTDTGAESIVKTFDYDYEGNTYYSLRDVAMALKGTEKAFSLGVTRSAVSVNPGGAYAPVGGENAPWRDGSTRKISLRKNDFQIGGEEVVYYSIIAYLPSGYYDCFLAAADLALVLDVDIALSGADALEIRTQDSLGISPASLEELGYFYGVNGALAGNATTGEVYYAYHGDEDYPIASTTKLMTSLLTLEALAAGRLSLEDKVFVSGGAWLLSASDDGVIPLKEGQQVPVRELLLATLLPSSNECALCLAEAVAGSEEAFVEMMNAKARELGLANTLFVNSHGLPRYMGGPIPAKRQNRMSAEDMFRLASYLLRVYPQITQMTSLKEADLETLALKVYNTNPMLQNMPEATGLKTGTTNKAGSCLVTSFTAEGGSGVQDLVVVVFGAEDTIERGRVTGLLAAYARNVLQNGMGDEPGVEKEQAILPVHAEAAVDFILRAAQGRLQGAF